MISYSHPLGQTPIGFFMHLSRTPMVSSLLFAHTCIDLPHLSPSSGERAGRGRPITERQQQGQSKECSGGGGKHLTTGKALKQSMCALPMKYCYFHSCYKETPLMQPHHS